MTEQFRQQEAGIELYAHTEYRAFNTLLELEHLTDPGLKTITELFRGQAVLSQTQMEPIVRSLHTLLAPAEAVVRKVQSLAGGAEARKAILVMRAKVKLAMAELEDDTLRLSDTDPDTTIAVPELGLHRYFEQRIYFDLAAAAAMAFKQRLSTAAPADTAKLSAQHQAAVGHARDAMSKIRGYLATKLIPVLEAEVTELEKKYVTILNPDFKESTPASRPEVKISDEEIKAIATLTAQGGKTEILLQQDSLEKALQKVTAFSGSVATEKLTPTSVSTLERIQTALQEKEDEAADGLTDPYKDVLKALAPPRGTEILAVITEILNAQAELSPTKKIEQPLRDWSNAIASIMVGGVAGLSLSGFLSKMEGKLAANQQISNEDLESLQDARRLVEGQGRNINSVRYADPAVNDQVHEGQQQIVTELLGKIEGLEAKAYEQQTATQPERHGQTRDYYEALKEFLDRAGGGEGELTFRYVGFESDPTKWTDRMVQAHKEMTAYKNVLTNKEEKNLSEVLLNLHDLSLKALDGKSHGATFIELGQGMDNFIDAPKIRELIKYYDIYDFVWRMRQIAIDLLVGNIDYNNTEYTYNIYPKINSDGSFQVALRAKLFESLGMTEEEFMDSKPNIRTKDALDVLFNFSWNFNLVPGKLMDEVYQLLAVKGSSIAHNPDKLVGDEKASKEPFHFATDPLAMACYQIMNPPVVVAETANLIVFFSEDAIEQRYSVIGEEVPPKVLEYWKKAADFLRGMLGKQAEQFIGKVGVRKHPWSDSYTGRVATFPTPFESLMDRNLDLLSRYFKTDAIGFSSMNQTVFEDFGKSASLSSIAIRKNINSFIKMYGMSKLAQDGLSNEYARTALHLYVSRMFRSLDYVVHTDRNKRKRKYFFKREFKRIERQANGALTGWFVTNEGIETIEKNRAELARGIAGGATTLKVLSDVDKAASIELRKYVLENILGAIVKVNNDKKETFDIVGFEPIPPELANILHFNEVEYYVKHHVWEESNTGRPAQRKHELKESAKGTFSDRGFLAHFEPPHLTKEESK